MEEEVAYYGTVDQVWVPVTTERRVLRLRMEERPPIWRVAADILNKLSRTADKGGLGEVLKTPHRKICFFLRIMNYGHGKT